MLFYLALGVSLVLTAAFCVSVLAAASRADRQLNQTAEAQLLRILEETGVSGLAAAFDRSRTIVLPGSDRLDLALWQIRGDTRRLLLETNPGVADAFVRHSGPVQVAGVDYQIQRVDVAKGARDWALPMNDVELSFGFAHPTLEMRRAHRTVGIIIVLSISVCGLMSFLQALHWRHYRRSLSRINALLDRYSNGEIGVRFEDETPSPELRALGRHLNIVLPRIDTLFEDLRALSAHLAHELRTPLQTIRSNVRKIIREDDRKARSAFAHRIDQSIDGADARLQTIMQLFRLQADASVTLTSGIPFGQVLEDLVYDFEEQLQATDRRLDMAIDLSVRVTGNVHLIELMISNLLSNAAKYAKPGSDIMVALTVFGGCFRLVVSNAGTLSEGLSEHAFDRYAQGIPHRSLTGSGLGLALVQAIADRHKFNTEIYDEVAEGGPRIQAVVTGEIEGTAHA